jgi:hypothetical protein
MKQPRNNDTKRNRQPNKVVANNREFIQHTNSYLGEFWNNPKRKQQNKNLDEQI